MQASLQRANISAKYARALFLSFLSACCSSRKHKRWNILQYIFPILRVLLTRSFHQTRHLIPRGSEKALIDSSLDVFKMDQALHVTGIKHSQSQWTHILAKPHPAKDRENIYLRYHHLSDVNDENTMLLPAPISVILFFLLLSYKTYNLYLCSPISGLILAASVNYSVLITLYSLLNWSIHATFRVILHAWFIIITYCSALYSSPRQTMPLPWKFSVCQNIICPSKNDVFVLDRSLIETYSIGYTSCQSLNKTHREVSKHKPSDRYGRSVACMTWNVALTIPYPSFTRPAFKCKRVWNWNVIYKSICNAWFCA